MKNYNSVMKEIEKRIASQQSTISSFGGVMGRAKQPKQSGQGDVIDSLAGYISVIRKTKEELLKNGNE